MTGPVKFELLANTKTKGMKIDLFFDNLSISSDFSEAPSISYFASGGSGNDGRTELSSEILEV